MAGPKVKLKDQLGRVVRLGGDSIGATVGKDLRWPDGSLVKSAEIRNQATDAGGTGPAATVWKLIREVPANLQRLARLAGVGFATRDAGGEWHQRSITAGQGVQVSDGDGVAGDPVVGLAELPDAGGGTLQKTLRDGYGRLAGTSSADTGDLPEGSNLYFTDGRADARAVAAVGAHEAEADPHPQYTTAAEAAAAAPVQSVNGRVGAVEITVPKGHIDGLVMQWGGAAQLTITAGAAYIPSAGSIIELPAAVTKAGLALSPSTWHHVYMHNDLGVPGIEIVATAPAEPYSGTARTKAGDNTRRYLGSLLTDPAGGIYRFGQNGDQIDYLVAPAPPFRVLSGGVATTKTAVSLAGVVPITSQYVIANTINNSDLQLFVDVPEIGNTGLTARYTCLANQRTPVLAVVPGRVLTYQYAAAPTGSGAFIDVWGYKYGR